MIKRITLTVSVLFLFVCQLNAQDGPIRLPRVEKDIITPDQMGGIDLRGLRGGGLIDFSFNVGAAVGGATVDDETLLDLQRGHHDFNQRGFNLQYAELGVYGEVDPYLSAQAIMNMGFNGRTGDSLDDHFEPMSTSMDPSRDRRSRFSPMVLWTPSHFTRIRLQYNYDHAQHLEAEHSGESHGVWLGIDFMIGKHPAHRF